MAKPPQASGRSRPREFFRQFACFRQALLWAGEHPLLCACGFFVFAFALRLLCARWPGPILLRVIPDELRYLHLSKSIAQGGPLLIFGQPADFQKILYPLLISPVYMLIRNPLAQVEIIKLINCLAMASVVFPTALLVKKLTAKPAVLLLTLVFVCALPDFMYTATFMSEPLYWPLCLWVFYFFHAAMAENQPRRRLPLFALFGFFTYLSYLTKEVGAAFLIAGAAMLLIEGIRSKAWKQNGLALAVSIAAFFVPFLVVKQALFAGLGNSYAGVAQPLILFALKSPDDFLYMIYGAAALFAAAMLSFYILPVLLPLFGFRKMSGEKRRMYLFAVFSLAVTAGAIAATVYGWEERGAPLPRMHMRLLAPIAIPFVILCFDSLLSKGHPRQKKSIPALTAAACALLLVLLSAVPAQDTWFDRASMKVSELAQMLFLLGMGKASTDLIWRAFLLLMLALAVTGAACFLRGKKRAILAMLLCVMLAASVADNLISYRVLRLMQKPVNTQTIVELAQSERKTGDYFRALARVLSSGITAKDLAPMAHAAVSVNDFLLREGGDGHILVCSELYSTLGRQTFLTYASQQLRTFPVLFEQLLDYLEPGSRELSLGSGGAAEVSRMDYLIVSRDFNPFTNVEVIFEQSPYLVLRNLDPTKLCFSGEKVDFYG